MKNKIWIFILLALMQAFTGAKAQFSGGNGRGDIAVTKTLLLENTIYAIYDGGNGRGDIAVTKTLLKLENTIYAIYSGGNGRGDIAVTKTSTRLGNNFVTAGNWSVTANWSAAALPGTDEIAYIMANATLDQDVTIKGLSIHTGNSLTIPSGKRLTVTGTLANTAGNSGLVIESGGSLLHNSNDVAATIKREITGSTTLTAMRYHFVSIPTQYTAPTSNLFLGSYLYKLDPTQTSSANNYGAWVALGTSTTTPLSTNQGYMIYYPEASKTYTFEGNLNNGVYSYALTGHSGEGVYTFNLIPNPYPSSIVWNTSGNGWTKSAGIGGSCYIWNAANGNYSTIASSTTSYIPVGQALMVLATNEASPTLSVNNAARTHSSQAFYKSGNSTENKLVIRASSNNYADETVVAFAEEATEAFDLQIDGMKLFGLEEAPQLYTLSSWEKYSLNNLPLFQDQRNVDMNFETQFTGEVTLNFESIESFNPSVKIHLLDQLTGQTINLRSQQVYRFNHNPENAANRFKLLFGGSIGLEETAAQPGKMWISGKTLYINTPKLTGQTGIVEVYNASGQRLINKHLVLSELSSMELDAKGFVVVKLTAGQEIITLKGILMR